MVSKLKITFFHYLYKRNSRGEAPIYCRIVLASKKQQFSTGLNLTPELWDVESQRAKGYSIEIQLLNRQLQEIYSELIRIEKQLYDEGGYNFHRGNLCSL